jgi:hypothetical protein
MPMRGMIAGLLSALLVVTVTGTAGAKSSKKERQAYDSYTAKYPGATPRQLRNARAYDRGEYYEMDSNAHPVGSRSWWELKEREGNGRGGFRF